MHIPYRLAAPQHQGHDSPLSGLLGPSHNPVRLYAQPMSGSAQTGSGTRLLPAGSNPPRSPASGNAICIQELQVTDEDAARHREAQGTSMSSLDSLLAADDEWVREMVRVRRDLHRHPELSWQEHRTANVICQFLDSHHIEHRSGVAETGVVAEIPGRQQGPFIALRADMDALPIREETGLAFASSHDGVMHACGHDGHVSMLLGAAAGLAAGEPPPLPIRLLFQPAEETGSGAQAMIEAGVLSDVAMIFGGHLDRHFNTGVVAVTDGPVNASSDAFTIVVRGRGGHAARPHETVDAVIVGSLMVMALQTIVSREINPAHPSVVSVGKFTAGTAGNVIADTAKLQGSIRAQDPNVREYLQQSIQRIASSVGELHGAEVEAQIKEGTPPLINPPCETQLARDAAALIVGENNVQRMTVANMGGEDFGYYLKHVPGCYVRVGAHQSGTDRYPAHSSKFDFDERALPVGAAYLQAVALTAGRVFVDGSDPQQC